MAVNALPYHVGVVVADLESATQQLTELLGLSWLPMQKASLRIDHGAAITEAEIHYVYSREGTPHFELIRICPGTPLATPGLHHLGFWTDDTIRSSQLCEAAGLPRESVCVDEHGAWVAGLYHLTGDGLRIELNDIGRSGPKFVRHLSGEA